MNEILAVLIANVVLFVILLMVAKKAQIKAGLDAERRQKRELVRIRKNIKNFKRKGDK